MQQRYLYIFGQILKFVHAVGLISAIYLTYKNYKYALFIWLSVIIFSLYFKGCIMTKLEHYLTKEKSTVIDPIIRLFNCKVNNRNRNILTKIIISTNIIYIIINNCKYYTINKEKILKFITIEIVHGLIET